MVTGAASGIGKAIAARFLSEGAAVGLIDLSGAAFRHAADALGKGVATAVADVSDETARKVALSLGFDIPHHSMGGGSDGNFTGALGIPTLDGLGVRGNGYHTLGEYIDVASMAPRGRLLAGLLATLS